jgi:SAM-dependent methyltransferase
MTSAAETRRGGAPRDAQCALEEFRRSGLALDALAGNTGKLRLSLDLAALASADAKRIRVLDVGCAGPDPLNLWAPFVPLAERFDLVGIDVHGLDATRQRARVLGLAMELRVASALALTEQFERESFDAVVSTQVLEHIPSWRVALAEMASMLRPGGTLFLTCDSAHLERPRSDRLRLAAKRRYAGLVRRAGWVRRVGSRAVSGEWEAGRTTGELRFEAERLGLTVERLAPYSLRDAKKAQARAGSATRQLWLAFEEILWLEAGGEVDLGLYTLLYLRARRR